jgi:hypothetical protein
MALGLTLELPEDGQDSEGKSRESLGLLPADPQVTSQESLPPAPRRHPDYGRGPRFKST